MLRSLKFGFRGTQLVPEWQKQLTVNHSNTGSDCSTPAAHHKSGTFNGDHLCLLSATGKRAPGGTAPTLWARVWISVAAAWTPGGKLSRCNASRTRLKRSSWLSGVSTRVSCSQQPGQCATMGTHSLHIKRNRLLEFLRPMRLTVSEQLSSSSVVLRSTSSSSESVARLKNLLDSNSLPKLLKAAAEAGCVGCVSHLSTTSSSASLSSLRVVNAKIWA